MYRDIGKARQARGELGRRWACVGARARRLGGALGAQAAGTGPRRTRGRAAGARQAGAGRAGSTRPGRAGWPGRCTRCTRPVFDPI